MFFFSSDIALWKYMEFRKRNSVLVENNSKRENTFHKLHILRFKRTMPNSFHGILPIFVVLIERQSAMHRIKA